MLCKMLIFLGSTMVFFKTRNQFRIYKFLCTMSICVLYNPYLLISIILFDTFSLKVGVNFCGKMNNIA